MKNTIKEVKARQIFDSRGNPTVEVDVITSDGVLGRAAVPSGASTGEYEAVELRDGGSDYMGKGVLNAVKNVNEVLSDKIVGKSVFDQEGIDKLLIDTDGTPNKANMGANAMLGISLAVAKAAAAQLGIPFYRYLGGVGAKTLPVPMMNIINGGSHSDAPIAFQEFMIVPVSAKTFSEAIKMGTEVFHNLKKVLSDRGLSITVGDEGGFAPELEGTEDAIKTIGQAVEKAGYVFGKDIFIALDCAASEFYKDGKYDYTLFEGKKGRVLSASEQVEYINKLVDEFPIISVEDGMDEDDWEGWKIMTDKMKDKVQLVGDDLFVTNVERLERGIKDGISNSILIKLNQIGTLSETIAAINMAHNAGFTSVVSHRSGETEDTSIADLTVALNTGQIKTGSLSRTDRLSKYNQLLRIEEDLGDNAVYLGKSAFRF